MENKYIDQIEQYVDGHLSSKERLAFEEALTANKDLAAAVAFHQKMITDLKLNHSPMNKQELKTIWENVKAERQLKRKLHLHHLVLAAAIFIGFAFLAVRMILFSQTDLAGEYFEVYPMNIFRNQLVDEQTVNLLKVSQAYQSGAYSIALDLLTDKKNKFTNNEDFLLYQGICHFQLDQINEAKETFAKLLDQSSTWDEHARWYLSLTYLKLKDEQSAKSLLQEIITKEKHFKKEESREILNELNP